MGLKSNLTTKPGPPELLRNAGLDFNGVHLPQPFRVGLAGLGSEASGLFQPCNSQLWQVASCWELWCKPAESVTMLMMAVMVCNSAGVDQANQSYLQLLREGLGQHFAGHGADWSSPWQGDRRDQHAPDRLQLAQLTRSSTAGLLMSLLVQGSALEMQGPGRQIASCN